MNEAFRAAISEKVIAARGAGQEYFLSHLSLEVGYDRATNSGHHLFRQHRIPAIRSGELWPRGQEKKGFVQV